MNKKLLSLLLTLCMISGAVISSASDITTISAPVREEISDVSTGHWAYTYVSFMTGSGIMPLEDGKFNGESPVTRGDFVQFLWNAVGYTRWNITAPRFTDVPADSPYYEAVEWAAFEGVTNGTSATTFSPNNILTRQEIFTFLHNVLPLFDLEQATPGTDYPISRFTDASSVSDWATIAIGKLLEMDIVTGTDLNTLEPRRQVNRFETASVLYRTMELGEALGGPTYMEFLHFKINGEDRVYEIGSFSALTPKMVLTKMSLVTGLSFTYTEIDVVGDEVRIHWAADASFMPGAADFTLSSPFEEEMHLYDVTSTAQFMLDSVYLTFTQLLGFDRVYFTDESDDGLDLSETAGVSFPGDEWYSGNFDDYFVTENNGITE